MVNKSRRNYVIAIFTIAVVVLYVCYWPDQPTADRKPQRAELDTVATSANNLSERDRKRQHPATGSSAELSPAQPVETAPAPPKNCEIFANQLNNHPAREQFIIWLEQELSADLRNSYYQGLKMDELLHQAQAADVNAMRMLAEKYLNYAEFQQYKTPAQQQTSIQLDHSALAQGRYWAEQAALHGYGGAFMSLLVRSYLIELLDLNRQLTASPQHAAAITDQITDTEILLLAYGHLSLEVMPQLANMNYPLRMQLQQEVLSAEESARFDEIYPNLLQEWRSKRAMLGQPAELNYVVPAEFEQFIQLQNADISCARNW